MSKLYVKNRYGQIPNRILSDKNLSLKAKGLWVYMQSKPDGWTFSIARIVSQVKEGKTAIQQAVKELEKNGLLVRKPIKDSKGKWNGYDYILLETPLTENQSTENRLTENPVNISNKEYSKKEYSNKEKENPIPTNSKNPTNKSSSTLSLNTTLPHPHPVAKATSLLKEKEDKDLKEKVDKNLNKFSSEKLIALYNSISKKYNGEQIPFYKQDKNTINRVYAYLQLSEISFEEFIEDLFKNFKSKYQGLFFFNGLKYPVLKQIASNISYLISFYLENKNSNKGMKVRREKLQDIDIGQN